MENNNLITDVHTITNMVCVWPGSIIGDTIVNNENVPQRKPQMHILLCNDGMRRVINGSNIIASNAPNCWHIMTMENSGMVRPNAWL